MQYPERQNSRVLVVEDDPYVLSFMESSLEMAGLGVLPATSAEEAMEICNENGLQNISAVLSDYRLPGASGIDFVRWVREQDENLATLIITGQGDKTVVQQSLAAGVFDYIEKPVTHQVLSRALEKAVLQTARQRKFDRTRRGLAALESLDQSMNLRIPERLRDQLHVFYQPLHEVGGDFLITHHDSSRGWMILVGDVAGHDIRSGYVSSYFQGMFRGCLESGSSIEEAFRIFNRSLRQQDLEGPGTEPISLALSTVQVRASAEELSHWNYGFTPCQVVTADGIIRECPYGNFPLGWIGEIDPTPIPIQKEGNQFLYVFTDGLVEFAYNLDLNPFSLIFRLLHGTIRINSLPVDPSDDILIARYTLNTEIQLNATFEPILSEHYAGTEIDHIDQLQSNWRRSLTFALDDELGDRLYDLLICIREGMLNALIHGCERSPDKFAHLQISLNRDRNVLRVVIDDPGRGHSFNLKERLKDLSGEAGKHLGLGIIQHLSDAFVIENRGTSLAFDFELKPA